MAKAFIPLLFLISICLAGPAKQTDTLTALYEPVHDSAILKGLELLYFADYKSSDSILAKLPDSPARAYFQGLAWINRFDDLGDTSALFAAQASWERVDRAADTLTSSYRRDANFPLYRGLSVLQLSYVAGVTGGRIGAARLGRKAASLLKPLSSFAEAEAALALYDYYKATLLKGVDWVPFVTANQNGPLLRLETAIPRSRYLGEFLQTSLLWLYYDAARYDQGMPRIQAFLSCYPRSRPYRQMQADYWFRRGNLDSALATHLNLSREYRTLAQAKTPSTYLPLGYLSSVGNLAKLYSAQKKPHSLASQLAIWNSPEYKGMMKWLPASLRREVNALKK